jgi:hypothetical protein
MKLVDFASYREDNDVSLTTSGNRPMTFGEYLDIILDDEVGKRLMGSDIIGYGRYALTWGGSLEKYLGYNFTDVDAEIEFGFPPHNSVAAIGRFDPSETGNALSHQEDWPAWVKEAYVAEEYKGVTIHSWGDGLETHLDSTLVPPHVDLLGRARPLSVTDKYLFYAASVPEIQAMIGASQDKQDSLADLPYYASVANKLSGLHVYQAMIGDEFYINGDLQYEGIYPGPRLKNFMTFGMGLGRDEKGVFTAVVLYHENADNAEANVSLLQERIQSTSSTEANRPWHEIITDSDIYVEGNVLFAKLYSGSFSLWTMVYVQDTLLLHESPLMLPEQ